MDLPNQNHNENRPGSPTGQKKVEFDLNISRLPDFYEYRRKVKYGKYPNPFDASKRPKQGVLKDSTPTPINPFFKKAHKISYWTPEASTTQMIEQMDFLDEEAYM